MHLRFKCLNSVLHLQFPPPYKTAIHSVPIGVRILRFSSPGMKPVKLPSEGPQFQLQLQA